MAKTGRGRLRLEDAAKRVRVYLGGEVVADTTRPTYVWEIPYYPAYYIPTADVRMELLTPTETTERSPSRGTAKHFTVKGGDQEAVDGAWQYDDSPVEELRDLIRFDWHAMDAWFEEDEEIFVHPRGPSHRVDILASSRHVRVEIDGVEVANTTQPRLLFETSLPTRYYIPKTDARLDLLRPSDTHTDCPYKGTADYWSVQAGDTLHTDIVWGYKSPVRESAPIAGLLSFYNEKVDIYVDGELEDRPKTQFS